MVFPLVALGGTRAQLCVRLVAGRSIPMTLPQILMGLGIVILAGVILFILGRK
jgi:hypothetical protein